MIVVTGGIACGKSTFVEVAREMGINVVDADEWYHNLFVGSSIQEHWRQTLFGNVAIKTVAFRHNNWSIYEQGVADAFCTYIGNIRPDICVIPELFKRETYFRVNLPKFNVLTIERTNHVDAAIARDGHRSVDLTQKIFENQTPSIVRVERSDYLLYNEGSKDEFRQECRQWLESHLQEVSTRPTKGTNT